MQIANCKKKWTVGGGQWAVGNGRPPSEYAARNRKRLANSICNLQSLICGWLVAVIVACFAATARGEVDLPEPNRNDPIAVSAEAANRWTSGSYDVWLLKGNCRIQQGACDARCSEALLWIERADGDVRPDSKIIAYLEGGVELARSGPTAPAKVKDRTWLGRFTTNGNIQVYAAQ
ncbi:MAG: hypothetical protein ABSE63_18665, partial [Thermoguttaceae bacterium]